MKTYYVVIFFDGDIDITLYPNEEQQDEYGEEGGDGYDPTDFEHVARFAKTIKNSRIDKVIPDVKEA